MKENFIMKGVETILALPRDVGFDKDDFQKSRVFNETDSLVNYILNILLSKPGNYPTMPHIGCDISKYVKSHMDSLDAESLKGMIVNNCSDLMPYVSNDNVYVGVVQDEEGRDILLIKLPLEVNQSTNQGESDIYYAFYRDELNQIKFTFMVDKD